MNLAPSISQRCFSLHRQVSEDLRATLGAHQANLALTVCIVFKWPSSERWTMNLGWEAHFHGIVMGAWRAYEKAESQLSLAIKESDEVEQARMTALREGGAAALYLHHFSDIVAAEKPSFLPEGIESVRHVRAWLSEECVFLRGNDRVADVELLGDIADALKHAALTQRLEDRDVAARDAVVVVGRGFGELAFGEGKFGGCEQVHVLAKSRPRVLSSILKNVLDAWHRQIGWELPD